MRQDKTDNYLFLFFAASADLEGQTYWNLDKASNPRIVIISTSGSGKTQNSNSQADRVFN